MLLARRSRRSPRQLSARAEGSQREAGGAEDEKKLIFERPTLRLPPRRRRRSLRRPPLRRRDRRRRKRPRRRDRDRIGRRGRAAVRPDRRSLARAAAPAATGARAAATASAGPEAPARTRKRRWRFRDRDPAKTSWSSFRTPGRACDRNTTESATPRAQESRRSGRATTCRAPGAGRGPEAVRRAKDMLARSPRRSSTKWRFFNWRRLRLAAAREIASAPPRLAGRQSALREARERKRGILLLTATKLVKGARFFNRRSASSQEYEGKYCTTKNAASESSAEARRKTAKEWPKKLPRDSDPPVRTPWARSPYGRLRPGPAAPSSAPAPKKQTLRQRLNPRRW